ADSDYRFDALAVCDGDAGLELRIRRAVDFQNCRLSTGQNSACRNGPLHSSNRLCCLVRILCNGNESAPGRTAGWRTHLVCLVPRIAPPDFTRICGDACSARSVLLARMVRVDHFALV